MAAARPRSAYAARAEQKVGRTDPPDFRFAPLRPPVLDSLLLPSGLVRKLLAIVAPVGYGKTVLMSLLMADLRRAGKQCLWLALDERDTTVESLIGALQPLVQGRSSRLHPTEALFSGNEPVDRRIDALVDLFNDYPLPLTLFLDNLHYCGDPALGRLLDALAFGTRASVHLVLSGTREMPLNHSRAVLEGLIRSIGPRELSFGQGEVARLLGAELCASLGDEGVTRLAQQTEGWPAATRMAQIILSGSAQPQSALEGFSGSDEGLSHLLNRQVLSGFSAPAREFLLLISQLRSFCLDLCRQATGDEQAQSWLDDLVRRNVFIIPLDRNGQWYRLHGLFRDYLAREAERALSTAQRFEVLRRAAAWCEQQGYWREAVDYALASGSSDAACALLERIAAPFVRDRGDVLQYIRWLEALHERGIEAGPEAEYWHVWALAFCRRYEAARQHSARLGQRLARLGGDSADLSRRLAILRISIDSLTDHLLDAHDGAARWLAEATGEDDAFNLTAAHCIESGYHAGFFRFVESRRALQAARETAFQAGSAYVDGWVGAYAGLAPVYEGDYAAAYPELVQAVARARKALGEPGGIAGTLTLPAAKCAVEMGLDSEARHLLETGLASARTHGFVEATALGLDAALALWSGEDGEGISLSALREIAGAYAPRLSLMLSCFLIRRLLSLGRKDEAQDEATRLGLASGEALLQAQRQIPQMRDLVEATELELTVAGGRNARADDLIDAQLARAKAEGRCARQVDLLLLRARLAVGASRRPLLLRHLVQALRIATPRRIVRPFLLQAETLAAARAGSGVDDWGLASAEEHRFLADLVARLQPREPQADLSGPYAEPRLLGSLTPRELELLRLLEAGLSNQQVADRVDVSLATIKWHLQNLYAKLNVSSRSAALVRARALKLLGR